jgi:hypothetical protein
MLRQTRYLTPETCRRVPYSGTYQVLEFYARADRQAPAFAYCDRYVVVEGAACNWPLGPEEAGGYRPIPEGQLQDAVRELVLTRGRRSGVRAPPRAARIREPPQHCHKVRTLAPVSQCQELQRDNFPNYRSHDE